MLSPEAVNRASPAKPDLRSGPAVLPAAAARHAAVPSSFTSLALARSSSRRDGSSERDVALALVCLYCGSLAVLGIGGRDDQVAGMTFISHIAPAALTLAAFAALPRPASSGVLLAVGRALASIPPSWRRRGWATSGAIARSGYGSSPAFALAASRRRRGGVRAARGRPAAMRALGTICPTRSAITPILAATARARSDSGDSAAASAGGSRRSSAVGLDAPLAYLRGVPRLDVVPRPARASGRPGAAPPGHSRWRDAHQTALDGHYLAWLYPLLPRRASASDGFTSEPTERLKSIPYGTSLRAEVPRQSGGQRAARHRQQLRRQVPADPPDRADLPLHVRLRRPLRDVQQLEARQPQDGHDARPNRQGVPVRRSGRTSRTPTSRAASRPRATTWSTSAGSCSTSCRGCASSASTPPA